ncbi:hypothetical protein SLEP1_g16227 [Rubroshorea leprosula]|uniref:Uncharacterized protein n=1 Tax=Rubroshorea leprosula TaxID=152421 RepID=A0AAV5IVV2_9ROSI|nr:hypothetical protein SLEP1_g16227 [Rubroshorea leprosula]
MCRSTDFHNSYSIQENLLEIKAFFVRFSGLDTCHGTLPESLTLLYLPRINETALEVSGSKIRPDSSAFVTLHRVVKARTGNGEAIYGSRERVRAGDGVRFEVYSMEEKVLKGIFRKEEGGKWKLECKCALETGDGNMAGANVAVAEVCVAVEGHVAMGERVEMVVRRRRKNRRMGFDELEEIPEEREADTEFDGLCCSRCGESEGGGDMIEGGRDCDGNCADTEMDLEGVSWAVDLGLWVMCLGVGYLVSKVSARSLRRLRLL